MPSYKLEFDHDGESVLRKFEAQNDSAAIVSAHSQMPHSTTVAKLTIYTDTYSRMVLYIDRSDRVEEKPKVMVPEFEKPSQREELERSMLYRETQYRAALEVEHRKAEEDLRAEKDWIAKKFPV